MPVARWVRHKLVRSAGTYRQKNIGPGGVYVQRVVQCVQCDVVMDAITEKKKIKLFKVM